LTPASHRPPIWGSPGGMNCMLSCWWLYASVTDSLTACRKYRESTVEAPTRTWRGHPLLDTKRAKAARNFSAVKSDVGFRWMAFIEKLTKTITYPFVRDKLFRCNYNRYSQIWHADPELLTQRTFVLAECHAYSNAHKPPKTVGQTILMLE